MNKKQLQITHPVVYRSQQEITTHDLGRMVWTLPIPTKTLFDIAIMPLREELREAVLDAHKKYAFIQPAADEQRITYLLQLERADLENFKDIENLHETLGVLGGLEQQIRLSGQQTIDAIKRMNGLQTQYDQPTIQQPNLIRRRYAQRFLDVYQQLDTSLASLISKKRPTHLYY